MGAVECANLEAAGTRIECDAGLRDSHDAHRET
jgi:hypothetical protein